MISGGYKMPYTIDHQDKANAPSFETFAQPCQRVLLML